MNLLCLLFQNFTSDFSSVSVEDIFCGEEREALLNQIICEHFLRQGKLDIAESLSEVNRRTFNSFTFIIWASERYFGTYMGENFQD